MTPTVSLSRKDRQAETVLPLSALLVIPIPKYEPPKRTLWMNFLHDLSFALPAFGSVLGLSLALTAAPFVGATLFTVCPIILAFRLRAAYRLRCERKQIAALEQWYRAYLSEHPRARSFDHDR
jgi:O-antigen/teichoic acid export membrane protein